MTPSGEDLAHIVLSNRFASSQQVKEVQDWGTRYHPDKDLPELLFMKGLMDRSRVSLVRRLAKMAPKRSPRVAEGEPPEPASEERFERRETAELPPGAPGQPPARSGRQRHDPDPAQVGRYEILERLARGGMGVVYKARHPELDRVFALKVLTEQVEESEEALARFQREAKIAARLEHPSVVRVHDAGTDDGTPFLVMDFVDGPNLQELIKEEGVGVRKAAQISLAIALALHHAHEEDIVHRDVKPENILMERSSGEPKITDFGIVKDLQNSLDDARLTRTGYTLGSPCYMAPEQATGQHDLVGPTADVYSLGATLYEMLTGEPPFDGETIPEILSNVVRTEPIPPRAKNSAVPRDLEIICLKALEKEPQRRYQTAKALAQDLECFLADEPISAKPAGWTTKSWRFLRRHQAIALLISAFLVVLTALALYLGYSERSRRLKAQEEGEKVYNSADSLLELAANEDDPTEKRRAWYEALRQLDWLLQEDPNHARARALKRQAVIGLGDHLIERGEPSFAEFVFGMGTGLLDAAVITSRIETARQASWVEAAREQERAGNLPEALRLYQSGLSELQRAGYQGSWISEKVLKLRLDVKRGERQRQVEELHDLAQEAAAQGDHATAYTTYQSALDLAPQDRDLAGKAAVQRERAEAALIELSGKSRGVRAQVLLVLEKQERKPPGLQELMDQGDAHLEQAAELIELEQFSPARREVDAALVSFTAGYSLSSAHRARELAEAAARQAESAGAARFAPQELGAAGDLQLQGGTALDQGEFGEAEQLFERAASAFRQAARTGSGKGAVSDVQSEARNLRAQASRALVGEHRLASYFLAEEEFQQAETHYSAGEYDQATGLYRSASEQFSLLLELAPTIRESFALREKVREIYLRCQRNLAAEFTPQLFKDGEELAAKGDTLLDESDPVAAGDAYRRAASKLNRASERSQPFATARRECEDLRARAAELQEELKEEKLEWDSDYQSGMKNLKAGDEFFGEGRRSGYRLAKRRFERALEDFRRAGR